MIVLYLCVFITLIDFVLFLHLWRRSNVCDLYRCILQCIHFRRKCLGGTPDKLRKGRKTRKGVEAHVWNLPFSLQASAHQLQVQMRLAEKCLAAGLAAFAAAFFFVGPKTIKKIKSTQTLLKCPAYPLIISTISANHMRSCGKSGRAPPRFPAWLSRTCPLDFSTFKDGGSASHVGVTQGRSACKCSAPPPDWHPPIQVTGIKKEAESLQR